MNDLLDLVERATTDVPWEPDRLVAAGMADGRARLRRRRLAGALTGVAAAAVVGTGLAVLGLGGVAGSRAIDPAGSAVPSSAAGSASPSASPAPSSALATTRQQLAITAADFPKMFGSLVPGVVTRVPGEDVDAANPIVDFRWNGFAVRVGVTSDSYATGRRVTDPRQRCESSESADEPCGPGRVPGSYEQSMTWTEPAQDGGATVRVLTVYFAQGWDVTVMECNAADFKQSPAITADVPLSLDQLRQAAYSETWFK